MLMALDGAAASRTSSAEERTAGSGDDRKGCTKGAMWLSEGMALISVSI